jgi:hypothetical protein
MADEKLSLKLDVSAVEGAKSVKELKQIIKDAKNEAVKFQEGSKEFLRFSNIASQANDKLKAVNETIVGLDPGGRAKAFANLGSTIAGGFQAAQGAAALFGKESEDLQKTLLKVQAATALAQGIQQVKEFGKAWTVVNTILKANPIGVILAALTAIAVAIDGLLNKFGFLKRAFDAVGNAINTVTDFLGLTNKEVREAEGNFKAFNEQLEKNKVLNEAIVESMRSGIDLLKARGATAKQVFEEERKLIDFQIKLLQDEAKAFEKLLRAKAGREDITQDEINKAIQLTTEIKKLNDKRLVDELSFQKTSADAWKKYQEQVRDERLRIIKEEEERLRIQLDAQKILFEKLAGDARKETQKTREDIQLTISTTIPTALETTVTKSDIILKKFRDGAIAFNDDLQRATQFSGEAFSSLNSLGIIFGKNQEKLAKFQKQLAKVQILVDTAKALSGAVAAAASTPFPANLGAIATGVATVLAQIAKAKQIFSSAGDTPTLNIPTGASAAVGGVPLNPISNQTTLLNPDGTPVRPDEGKDQRVFVVETDITETQNKVKAIESKSQI